MAERPQGQGMTTEAPGSADAARRGLSGAEARRDAREAPGEGVAGHAVLDRLPVPVVLIGADLVLRYVNGEAAAITGYSVGEALGHNVLSFVLPSSQRLLAEQLGPLVSEPGARNVLRAEVHRKDGTTALVEATLQNRLHDPTIGGIVAVLRDVTHEREMVETLAAAQRESRALEQQLILTDRLVSLGSLAAGITHEINNPLAYVIANIEFLAEDLATLAASLPPGRLDALMGPLADAREGAQRIRNIVRDLRHFSRADDRESDILDVRPVIASAVNVTRNEIRHRARLVLEVGEVPFVQGNSARLAQVFVNLLTNAVQAIPEGDAERNEVRLSARAADDGRALVEVADTGAGITPENIGRIFDPFFTTRPVGVGTGLGLSICHGIVSGMGGAVEVESRPGAGSTFRVLLPAAIPA